MAFHPDAGPRSRVSPMGSQARPVSSRPTRHDGPGAVRHRSRRQASTLPSLRGPHVSAEVGTPQKRGPAMDHEAVFSIIRAWIGTGRYGSPWARLVPGTLTTSWRRDIEFALSLGYTLCPCRSFTTQERAWHCSGSLSRLSEDQAALASHMIHSREIAKAPRDGASLTPHADCPSGRQPCPVRRAFPRNHSPNHSPLPMRRPPHRSAKPGFPPTPTSPPAAPSSRWPKTSGRRKVGLEAPQNKS